MKLLRRTAFFAALVVFVTLLLRNDLGSILGLLGEAGWSLLWLIPLRCITLGLDVQGWRLLILEQTEFRSLFVIAWIREAINRLLPVANVGGELVGVHLLVRRGVSYPAAVGSITVEIALNILAQVIFLAVGVACLLQAKRFEMTNTISAAIAGGIAVALLVFWMLRTGAFFAILSRLAARLGGSGRKYAPAIAMLGQIDSATRELASSHFRLAKSLTWQVSGLIGGSAETWLVLRWLGHASSIDSAVALESLTLAARSVFFVAPAGLGVQEAGLIGLGSELGLSTDVAIALSLAKRAREIVFGLPALAVWQLMAGSKATSARAPPA